MARILDVTPDIQQAESLRKMALSTLKRIDETDKQRFTTQVVKDYYDILHYLLEGLSLSTGKKVEGRGAHAALISFVCQQFDLEPSVQRFLQDLRRFRNQIAYEGFFIQPDYLDRNEHRIKLIAGKMDSLLEETLKK